MKKALILLLALPMFGCATALSLGGTVCEAALGGSEAGKLCEDLAKLKAGDQDGGILPELPGEDPAEHPPAE